MRLVFFGPPGAGKGTQGARLAAHFGVPHIATGDMFRHAVEAGTPLGRKVREYLDRGELVPDDLTNELVRERLGQPDASGFVLDGYPRTVEQVAGLDQILEEQGAELDRVVRFLVTGDEIVARLSGRWICPTCKAVYHVDTHPPQTPGVCDNDGTALVQRDDDQEETVLRRLEVYGRQTKPLLDNYAERGLLVEVDAIASPDEVFRRLLKAVDGL